MPTQGKILVGATIIMVGLIMSLSSLTYLVAPSQSLTVNTFGILISVFGGVMILGNSIAEGKKLVASMVSLISGILIIFYSLSLADPFMTLFVHTVGLLIAIFGCIISVSNHEAKSARMITGISIIIIGLFITLNSLTSWLVQGPSLQVNTIGILIAALGGIITIKED